MSSKEDRDYGPPERLGYVGADGEILEVIQRNIDGTEESLVFRVHTDHRYYARHWQPGQPVKLERSWDLSGNDHVLTNPGPLGGRRQDVRAKRLDETQIIRS